MNRDFCQADFPFFSALSAQNPAGIRDAVFLDQNAAKIAIPGQPSRTRNPSLESRTVSDESKPKSATYADAGVDDLTANHVKERIAYLAQKTFNRNVLGEMGGFGALFRLDLQRWKNPILVSAVNGVGAKLKVAFELGMH